MRNDKIDDSFLSTLRRALQSEGIDPATIDKIIPEVQAEWGGDRPYIAKVGEQEVRQMRARDAAICRDHAAGERTALLARRYGITARRVQMIVRSCAP